MIIGVCIKHKGITVYLPKPNRHHDCIRYAVKELGLPIPIDESNSGFYLEGGTYLNRPEALTYARKHNQLIRPTTQKELCSEDIW